MAVNWQGLLSDPRLMDISTGLLAQSGYSTTPVTFGQAMGGAMQHANQRDVERVRLQAAREQMEQQKKQQEAMEQLQGLFTPPMSPGPVVAPSGPTPIATEQGRMQAMGLLSQVAPGAVAQGMMQQMFAQPDSARVSTDLNTFRELNPGIAGTPGEQEAFLAYMQNKNPQAGVEAVKQQAELEMLIENLQAKRAEREASTETEAQTRQATRRAIVTDLSSLEKMAEINDRLEGTALESGRPAVDVLRSLTGGVQAIQDVFGVDSSQAANLKADFDTFKKYSTDFVVGSLDRLAGGGAITQGKFDALINANANLGASPQTNRQIIANNIESLLDGAEIAGFTIEPEMVKKYRELANKLKGGVQAPNPPASALTNQPMQQGQDRIQELQRQLDEADRRILELRGGR